MVPQPCQRDLALSWFRRRAALCCTGSETSPATSDGPAGETYGPVIGAITLLLRACQEVGSVRPGPGPDDVLLLMDFLWRIDSPDWEPRAARLLDLVMDGLRAGAPGPR